MQRGPSKAKMFKGKCVPNLEFPGGEGSFPNGLFTLEDILACTPKYVHEVLLCHHLNKSCIFTSIYCDVNVVVKLNSGKN